MAVLTFNPTSGANNRLYYTSTVSWVDSRDAATGEGIQINGVIDSNFLGGTSYSISRVGEVFNTSSLPDNAVISSVTLQLYVTSVTNANTTALDIVSFAPTDSATLVVADYAKAKWGETPYASINYASLTTSAYNTFTLNAAGIAAVSLTGNSVFGVRCARDTANSAPTGENRALYQTNNAANPEILTVTYTVPSGGFPFVLF